MRICTRGLCLEVRGWGEGGGVGGRMGIWDLAMPRITLLHLAVTVAGRVQLVQHTLDVGGHKGAVIHLGTANVGLPQ